MLIVMAKIYSHQDHMVSAVFCFISWIGEIWMNPSSPVFIPVWYEPPFSGSPWTSFSGSQGKICGADHLRSAVADDRSSEICHGRSLIIWDLMQQTTDQVRSDMLLGFARGIVKLVQCPLFLHERPTKSILYLQSLVTVLLCVARDIVKLVQCLLFLHEGV